MFKSGNISISAHQLEIMNALDMDQGLVGAKGSCSTLEIIWKCYTTIMKTITKVGELKWALEKKPTDSEVIGVYGGKSTFYEQVRVLHVSNFILLWLNGWSGLVRVRMILPTFGVITR